MQIEQSRASVDADAQRWHAGVLDDERCRQAIGGLRLVRDRENNRPRRSVRVRRLPREDRRGKRIPSGARAILTDDKNDRLIRPTLGEFGRRSIERAHLPYRRRTRPAIRRPPGSRQRQRDRNPSQDHDPLHASDRSEALQ